MPSRRRHREQKSPEMDSTSLTSLAEAVGVVLSDTDKEILEEVQEQGGSHEHAKGANIAGELGLVPSRRQEIIESIRYLVSRGLLKRVETNEGYIICTPDIYT